MARARRGPERSGGRAGARDRHGAGGGAHEPWAWAAERSRYASSVPEPLLTSHRNPRFRQALALRESSERRSRHQIIVDGAREIERAIAGGVRPVEAWVSYERVAAAGLDAQNALASVRDTGTELVEASPELIARLSYGDRDAGMVLIAESPPVSI